MRYTQWTPDGIYCEISNRDCKNCHVVNRHNLKPYDESLKGLSGMCHQPIANAYLKANKKTIYPSSSILAQAGLGKITKEKFLKHVFGEELYEKELKHDREKTK